MLSEFPVLVLVAIVIAFLLRSFVVQVFYIPSSSMVPTLMIDDRMVVEKLSYLVREPSRGDVVVFSGVQRATPPEGLTPLQRALRSTGQFVGVVPLDASDLVKRVVAFPGEEVQLIEGVLHVDGVAFIETYRRGDDRSNYGPVVVPPGTLFFLGDNRSNSSDSRGALGFVARERVIGRAFAVIWPSSNAGRLTGGGPTVAAAATVALQSSASRG